MVGGTDLRVVICKGNDGGDRLKIRRATLDSCSNATGTVVVIDVIRAFTTAAFAFSAGARDIALVSGVAEAFALRKCAPGVLLMGEEGGRPIPGFDYGNSPAALVGQDLRGRRLVQRTSQGTQGVVLSGKAEDLLVTSFVCASATAQTIRLSAPDSVTFVVTGANRPNEGDKDAACADFIEALLRQGDVVPEPFLNRVRFSPAGRRLVDPKWPEYPAADLPYCLQVDRFGFVMRVRSDEGLLLLEAIG
jgi:2-phosphosulfolactate phosphatase